VRTAPKGRVRGNDGTIPESVLPDVTVKPVTSGYGYERTVWVMDARYVS
jgi:hypothetical protein